jgi:CRISP-associated protein Cas1
LSQWSYSGESAQALAGAFRGWEGTATRYYFQSLSAWLPPAYQFAFRSKRPAYDPFNALLNYLYGMLYPMVELGLMKAGLDPYTGVLHADEYNRPTMVYDAIEMYRHWSERVALELCRQDRLPPDAFTDTEREGVRLAAPGKGIVIEAFLSFMQEKVIQRRMRKRATHIDLDATRLAANLKTFRPTILLT